MDIGSKLKNTYLELPEIFYTIQKPTLAKSPELIKLNVELIKELDLNEEFFKSKEGLNILSGNEEFDNIKSLAEAYAGHQFGSFAMLGDGRAILLGEIETKEGKIFDIQLKGSGRTNYSRGGDGRAALKPMLREYIISEGMNGLKIPTSRSLAVVTTGENVYREDLLKGAILTRIAKSHIRVGTFQYAMAFGEKEDLKALADYTIKRHYKECEEEENKYKSFLDKVIENQAKLISKWMLVGFIHGVMNTDNMLISGETIDYGPCAFMDEYDINTAFSSIDMYYRYAYGNQPSIGTWNLARFAETLIHLLDEDRDKSIEIAQESISKFSSLYKKYWLKGMRNKLGLFLEEDGDEELINKLFHIMQKNKIDYTNMFVALTLNDLEYINLKENNELEEWIKVWRERVKREGKDEDDRIKLMKENNPYIIPRNYFVEEALEMANNSNYTYMNELLEELKNPYAYSESQNKYTKTKKWDRPYRTYCGT